MDTKKLIKKYSTPNSAIFPRFKRSQGILVF